MSPFSADPAASSYTYFYQSAYTADRSATVLGGTQSSTGPSMPTNFVALAAMKRKRR